MKISDPITVTEGQNLGACSLCMSELLEGDIVSSLTSCKVSHLFHTICVRPWVEQNKSCLNCKGDLDPYTVEDLSDVASETSATNSNIADIPPDPEKEDLKKPVSSSAASTQVVAQTSTAPNPIPAVKKYLRLLQQR